MIVSLQSLIILAFLLLFSGVIAAAYLIIQVKREAKELKLKLNKEQKELKEQKDRMKKLIQIAEETQKRIAIELHDNLGASLNMAKNNVSVIKDHINEPINQDLSNILHHTSSTLQEVVYNVRNISKNLQPDVLERQGIIRAINDYVQGILLRRNLEIEFKFNTDISHLTSDVELVIYRIVQESVNNTVKYAKATRIDLDLQLNGDSFYLKIKDNGIGFNVSKALKKADGIGLLNMQIRADQANSDIKIWSEIGEGTTITVQNNDQGYNSRRSQTFSAINQ